jgi:hypothetical protein
MTQTKAILLAGLYSALALATSPKNMNAYLANVAIGSKFSTLYSDLELSQFPFVEYPNLPIDEPHYIYFLPRGDLHLFVKLDMDQNYTSLPGCEQAPSPPVGSDEPKIISKPFWIPRSLPVKHRIANWNRQLQRHFKKRSICR